ncbi:1,4-alpha-glucan branching enzyme [Cytobacillus oceanisediminis]|jgi:1,4-alpha-glucan branching enzyme|uniref:1,4-alpha-glucan branching enzyme GlgB n=1 Tax=Cytobacillus oceanisediminis TaxID=665099 RepID=A0A2V2ZUV7_9BACI|nr:1,4-alpha-glucan branching enzyme [Cytobacillus oceanisediminis]PWW26252.1 1,4-alpha-glucan branching enzyme [Cytobacillus oceanisediminis]
MLVDTLFPTDYQLHLFHEGTLYESHQLFGAHVVVEDGKVFTRFCVWAPNAEVVRLVGDFNDWNGEGYTLHRVNNEGVWFIQLDEDMQGALYKYEIKTKEGKVLLKADPYSFFSELRPNTASIVYSLEGYQWNDSKWMQKKEKKQIFSEPAVIYEVHLGSWKKKKDGSLLSYKELADELIPYAVDHGFTHIELLPVIEHPLDASWGYQGTGYYSATSRYGTPHEFMYFVDQCHQHGIGVILDWVPGHFCKDAHGLYQFDGTYLYEYETEDDRENRVWGTANFDLGKNEVQSFLISNAVFWMENYHIDGFRVDAVANIIYWPNRNGEMENPFGVRFLQNLNKVVSQYDPSFLMMAEDSTDWPQVTSPVHYGGLGFHYKWNMGWMNDVLTYMETAPDKRPAVHGKMTFSLLYAFTENFVLPLSHDEVVHGKKSLLDKMPGDYWQKFAQFRLLLGYMIAHPGKKLLFMGSELGQFSEWKDKEQLDWHLLDYEMHNKANDYLKELIKVYKRSKPLYELDHLHDGFEWIDVNNARQSIFSFIRKGTKEDDFLVIICNFTPALYHDYRIGVPKQGSYREIFNSDSESFGGANCINKKVLKTEEIEFHGKPFSLKMSIPPFGISILRPVKHRKERKGNGKEKMRSHAVSRREREQA